ncbi:MAG: hypothetical protein IJQ59_08935 [Bacteroidaceae bacterium]|nr:hypothetical protein [Bacteroidaceae bacterium]
MTLAFLYYWFYVVLTATTGGKVYATGDWRMPLSSEDFGDRIETRWVIAGTEGRSSCYAWVQPDEGYHFVGFMDENKQMVSDASTLSEIRLWCHTDSVKGEDGIVSGNDFFPTKPQTFTALFEPDVQTGISSPRQSAGPDAQLDDESFDLSGRRITTPRGGQIIVRNRRKVLYK